MKSAINKAYIKYLMSLGHFCSDFAQGTLSAVLPFLIASYHYNYTKAASLVMVSNLIGSVIQPLFGHLADKIDRPHLMTAGVIMAGGGMAAVGLISSYFGLCVAVVISGTGVALFHPQGAKTINRTAKAGEIGFSIGVFSFGGNVGFTLGPVIAAGAISLLGMKGTLVFFIPSLLFAILMAICFRNYGRNRQLTDSETIKTDLKMTGSEKTDSDKNDSENSDFESLRSDRWGSFVLLSVLVICRSIVYACIGTFLILYFTDVFGLSKAVSSTMLSIYYGISAVSALMGGRFADRRGYKKVMTIGFAVLFAALLGFAVCGNCENMVISIILLLPLGIGVSLGYSSMVALGQTYLPNHVGLASGFTLGLSVSTGGIVAPLMGSIADSHGLVWIFYIAAAVAVIPVIIAIILPDIDKCLKKNI